MKVLLDLLNLLDADATVGIKRLSIWFFVIFIRLLHVIHNGNLFIVQHRFNLFISTLTA